MTTQPFQVDQAEGRAVWHMGALMLFKAVGEQTGGRFWLAEQRSARGYSSPPHMHTREDELFYVLDGELTVTVGEEVLKAGPGSVTYAPRGIPHTYTVESETVRFLVLCTPAGFENWFIETGRPAESLTIPPIPEGGLPDVAAFIASLQAYGVEVAGPPPGAG